MFSKLFARQLAGPSAVLGQWFFAPVWNRRNTALNDTAFNFLDLQAGDHVLEIGFGGGYLLGKMLPVVTAGLVAGVDISQAMVSFCEKRYQNDLQTGRLDLQVATAEQLPFSANRFTRVCSVNSIFYWQDPPGAIREFRRVLQPAGRLVLCFTGKECLASRSFARHGLNLYEPGEVVDMLKTAGFNHSCLFPGHDRYRTYWCIVGENHPGGSS